MQLGELDGERGGATDGAPAQHQDRARRVVVVVILERDRPLAVRGLVARGLGRPGERHGPRAVGLGQRHKGPEQYAPQRGALRAGGRGAPRHR